VEVKARDGVQHRLGRDVDGDVLGQSVEHRGERVDPLGGEQQGHRLANERVDEAAEDDGALGHEQALAADEVALPDIAIRRDGRVVGILDPAEDQPRIWTGRDS
jgi:hypothetical protein